MQGPKTLDQFDIRGRSALVTGAASGIGLAYAECMAEAGAKVTLTDIDAEGAAREAQRLVDEGYEARFGVCDVSELDQVAKAFDEHVRAYGGCDIAFANAGLDVGNGFWSPEGNRNPDGQIDVYDPDRWYKSIGINLNGVFHTVREAARVMKANTQRRGGSIVITSSNAAEVNEAIVGVPYMAAKAGVKHFMRHAAYELAAHGIRVNAIAPGPTDTEATRSIVPEPILKQLLQQMPLSRLGTPNDLVGACLFLLSDASAWMTGQVVNVDGGQIMRP